MATRLKMMVGPQKRRVAAPAPPVTEVLLRWGADTLIIEDAIWCEEIALEARLPSAGIDYSLGARYSSYEARVARSMEARGLGSSAEQANREKGVHQGLQRPVAAKCLRQLLGLGLPAALRLADDLGPPERLLALSVEMEVNYHGSSTLDINFVFDGLKLYASGHIGREVRLRRVDRTVNVQQRALDNTWWDVSFDGQTRAEKSDSRWTLTQMRDFYLSQGEIVDDLGASLRKVSP
jgi:hypothetical protein